MLPYSGWSEGFQLCMQAELPEPVHFEMQKCICYVNADPSNVLDVDLHIVLHGKKCEGTE